MAFKKSLRPCALDERSLNIGGVKELNINLYRILKMPISVVYGSDPLVVVYPSGSFCRTFLSGVSSVQKESRMYYFCH